MTSQNGAGQLSSDSVGADGPVNPLAGKLARILAMINGPTPTGDVNQFGRAVARPTTAAMADGRAMPNQFAQAPSPVVNNASDLATAIAPNAFSNSGSNYNYNQAIMSRR